MTGLGYVQSRFDHVGCLIAGGNSRFPELQLKEGEPYEISLPYPPLEDKVLPTKIQLIREIPVDHECITACSHRGALYVGHNDGSVIKVDKQDRKTLFVKLDDFISSLRGYGGKIFILTGNGEDLFTVYVYDTDSHQLASWKHSTSSFLFKGNKFLIEDTKVSILDKASSNISVYSHIGQKLTDANCPYVGSFSEVVICPGSSDSVIISYRDGNTVFRLNIKTGEEEWMSNNVISSPQGVARYGKKYLIVTNKRSDKTKLWILDIKTGEGYIYYSAY